MPKITDQPLKLVQFRIFASDYERLKHHYGVGFGVNKAVRTMINTVLNQIEAQAQMKIDEMED